MFEQVVAHSESFLSQYLCRFRKSYNTQQALVRFLEKCKSILDNKGFTGAILMDLSKAFDCLNHELLIAKLNAYGFTRTALKHIHSYLTKRQQRVKINGSFSTIKCSSIGVPKALFWGPSYSIFILMISFTWWRILRSAIMQTILLSLCVVQNLILS